MPDQAGVAGVAIGGQCFEFLDAAVDVELDDGGAGLAVVESNDTDQAAIGQFNKIGASDAGTNVGPFPVLVRRLGGTEQAVDTLGVAAGEAKGGAVFLKDDSRFVREAFFDEFR